MDVDLAPPSARGFEHPAPPAVTAADQHGRARASLLCGRLFRPFLGALCLFGLWALFAPTVLGGSVTYVVTDGVSMLPHFHADDLVLLRHEATYHVGEVAGYENGQLHEVVMHRIVAQHGDRYVFRGDNNNFTDTYEPVKSQIVGAEWLHLPGWGRWLNYIRTPFVAAALLAALWIFSFRSSPASRRRRRRRHAR
jgi:signal peptidase I